MEHTNELKEILHQYFHWNKARMNCFVGMLIGLFAVRTVNLTAIACVFAGKAKQSSRYRRLQRFFSNFEIEYKDIAKFIFVLFSFGNINFFLSLDRTKKAVGEKEY